MTNEEFMFRLCTYVDVSMERIYYASGHIDQDMQEHAKKLVAVAEACKKRYVMHYCEIGCQHCFTTDQPIIKALDDLDPNRPKALEKLEQK